MKKFVFLSLLSLLSSQFYSTQLSAKELITIYDSGDTYPVDKYLYDSTIVEEPQNSSTRNLEKKNLSVFPVNTPSMSPGKLNFKKWNLPHMQTPLFILGADAFSRQWLMERKAELMTLGAAGMLVEVANEEEFEQIKNLAGELKIFPASGEDIAQHLQLEHYPALISRKGIEQ